MVEIKEDEGAGGWKLNGRRSRRVEIKWEEEAGGWRLRGKKKQEGGD